MIQLWTAFLASNTTTFETVRSSEAHNNDDVEYISENKEEEQNSLSENEASDSNLQDDDALLKND